MVIVVGFFTVFLVGFLLGLNQTQRYYIELMRLREEIQNKRDVRAMAINQGHNENGNFTVKNDAIREIRSIRLTDATWHLMGDRADEGDMTKADYLERLFSGKIKWQSNDIKANEIEAVQPKEEVQNKHNISGIWAGDSR